MTKRITVSLDELVAARIRRCGAMTRGGASGYLERLVRADELREAAAASARWYRDHPAYAEDSAAESDAALGDTA